MPSTPSDIWPTLRRMSEKGELQPLPKLRHFYRASVPYARTRPVEEEEVLMEVHPYATLSNLYALFYHGLTETIPKVLTAAVPADGKGGLLPADTNTEDWEGIPLVSGRRVPRILQRSVNWRRVEVKRYFGFELYRRHGYPVRVTTPERSLVDGLLYPNLSGGLDTVLRAWALARDVLDVDAVVYQAERLDKVILRQRVGFVLERLNLWHPALEEWRAHTERGGSRKLLASAPYAPQYDEHWDLSINAPIDALEYLA
jgi:predicted transcriptional regulator of viral defense system